MTPDAIGPVPSLSGHAIASPPARGLHTKLLLLLLCLKKNQNAPRPRPSVLFLKFGVLVANPEKLLCTVANPASGLLNREQRTKKKVTRFDMHLVQHRQWLRLLPFCCARGAQGKVTAKDMQEMEEAVKIRWLKKDFTELGE